MWEYNQFADDFEQLCKIKNDKIMITYSFDEKMVHYSYANVLMYVNRFLTLFQNNGLQQGDTIVTKMPNSPEAIVCFFAALIGGIHYAPIPSTASQRECDNWIRLVHPKMVIQKDMNIEYDPQIVVCTCKCDGDFSWLPSERVSATSHFVSLIYLMTSGTTGTPKAVVIDADKLWSSGKAFVQFYQIEKSSYRFWNYLPMSYLGGLYNLALIPLCCEGSFVISETFSGKMMLNFWNFVETNEINALWFVPSIIQGILKIRKLVQNQSHCIYGEIIKIAFLGTAPIQLELKTEFEEVFGIRLYENFALSETVFLTAEDKFNVQFRKQGSVGKKLPNISLKFIPIDGVEKVCSIWVKTPFLFEGYLSENGSIERVLDQDEYFNTKDLGYLDENDLLVLSGRSRDIIKKSGRFVSLAEIENIVGSLSYIDSVAAVPISHDFYGETYILCVIFKQQNAAEQQKNHLYKWMLNNFVSYKMPEKICVFDFFPKTSSGKIRKGKMSEILSKQI